MQQVQYLRGIEPSDEKYPAQAQGSAELRRDEISFINGLRDVISIGGSRFSFPHNATPLKDGERRAAHEHVRAILAGLRQNLSSTDELGRNKSGGEKNIELVQRTLDAECRRLMTLLQSRHVRLTEEDAYFLVYGIPMGRVSRSLMYEIVATALEPITVPFRMLDDAVICFTDVLYNTTRILAKAKIFTAKPVDDTSLIFEMRREGQTPSPSQLVDGRRRSYSQGEGDEKKSEHENARSHEPHSDPAYGVGRLQVAERTVQFSLAPPTNDGSSLSVRRRKGRSNTAFQLGNAATGERRAERARRQNSGIMQAMSDDTSIQMESCSARVKHRIVNCRIAKIVKWCWSKIPERQKASIKEDMKELKKNAKEGVKAGVKDLVNDGKSVVQEFRDGCVMAYREPFRFLVRNTFRLGITTLIAIVAKQTLFG